MSTRILTIACLALSLLAFGCDKGQTDDLTHDEASAEAPAKGEQAEATAEDGEATAQKKTDEQESENLEKVEVAKAGTTFDPAVKVEQLPTGAWYCDMGTVHFAAMEKPEQGKCPECGMKLKQYDPEELAAQKEKAVEAHEHGDDHAHKQGEHDHGGEDHDHAHEGGGHGHGDGHGHSH